MSHASPALNETEPNTDERIRVLTELAAHYEKSAEYLGKHRVGALHASRMDALDWALDWMGFPRASALRPETRKG